MRDNISTSDPAAKTISQRTHDERFWLIAVFVGRRNVSIVDGNGATIIDNVPQRIANKLVRQHNNLIDEMESMIVASWQK